MTSREHSLFAVLLLAHLTLLGCDKTSFSGSSGQDKRNTANVKQKDNKIKTDGKGNKIKKGGNSDSEDDGDDADGDESGSGGDNGSGPGADGDDDNDGDESGSGGDNGSGSGADGDDDNELGMDDSDSAGRDGDDDEDSVTIEDGSVGIVSKSINFKRLADTAAHTNCLYVTLNPGTPSEQPEEKLGCNKGGEDDSKVLLKLRKKGSNNFCNILRLRLTSQGGGAATEVWNTKDNSVAAKFFNMERPNDRTIKLQANDNGDDDFNDLNLTFSRDDDDVIFKIENTSGTCR
jgi:hypothetical protein